MKALSEPETKERDGMPFTVQRFATKSANVTVIRPVLSPEEYGKRIERIEKAAIELIKKEISYDTGRTECNS